MIAKRSALRCRYALAAWGSCLFLAVAVPAAGETAASPPADTRTTAVAPLPTDAQAVELFRSAHALQQRGLADLAEAQWAAFLDRFADSPLAGEARHCRGLCLFQLERYEDAQAEFQRVINDYPQLDAALVEQSFVNLGLAQFNAGQPMEADARDEAFDAAIATLTAQLERFPDGSQAPQAWFYRAEARYAQGKLTHAVRAYRAFVDRYAGHPLRARALYGLGVAQQELDHPADAAETLQRFLAEFSAHELAADVHLRYGEVLLELGRPADAETHFAAAAVDDFADADQALERQAACRCETHRYAAAAELYLELADRFVDSPLVPQATVAAGKCHYLAGDVGPAIAWLRRGQDLAGDDHELSAEAAHWLVKALVSDGQVAEAIATAEKAIAGAPLERLVELRIDRADALYESADRRAESVAAYATIAREFGNHMLAPQAAYMAAFAALEVGDCQSALGHAAAFRQSYPKSHLSADVCHVAAEAHLQLGDYGKSARAFARLLTDFPDAEAANSWRVRRALCLSLAEKHDEVIDTLATQWSDLGESLRAEAGLLVGQALLATDQPNRAAEVLTAVAAFPRWRQSDEVLLTLARAQHAAGQTGAAIATLDRLAEDCPRSPLLDRASYYRGEYQSTAGNYKTAIADFQQVVDRWPDSPLAPHAMLSKARLEYRLQFLASAQATLTTLLTTHAQHELAGQAYSTRATIRHEAGDYCGSIADVRALLKTNPSRSECSDAVYLRGLCETKLNRFGDAAETFESIVRDDPQYKLLDRVLYELAWAYQEAGQADRATATYQRLTREHGGSPLAAECWYRIGQSQSAGGQYAAAAESFQAARERATDDTLREQAAHKLAWTFFSQDEFAGAEQAFGKQLAEFAAGPLAADAAIMLAESRFARQDFAGALDAYTTALAKRPARSDLRALALLHAGQAAAQLEQWAQGLSMLEQCQQEYPDCEGADEVRFERGWALYHLDRLEEAQREFEAVAGRDADVLAARARFMVGEVQFANRQYDEAVRTFFQVAYGFGDEAAPEAFHTWQAEAMFEAARCLEQTQRYEAARKMYAELLERFPDSRKAVHARNSLAEIRTR